MAQAAQILRCGHCGGPVPILDVGSVTCLYCLRALTVPANVAAPLAAHRQAKVQIDQSLSGLSDARRSIRGPLLLSLVYGVVVAAIAGVGIFGLGLAEAAFEGTDSGPALTFMFMSIVYGGLVFAFVGGSVYARGHARRRLAALPLARVVVEGSLQAGCAVCGASLVASGDSIKCRCGHCGNESLLPAPLVKRRLQAQHRRIVELHARIGDAQTVVLSASDAMNNFAMYVLIFIGVASAIGYVVFFQIHELPPHLEGTERALMGFCPGLLIGFIFAVPAALSLRKRRKAASGAQPR